MINIFSRVYSVERRANMDIISPRCSDCTGMMSNVTGCGLECKGTVAEVACSGDCLGACSGDACYVNCTTSCYTGCYNACMDFLSAIWF